MQEQSNPFKPIAPPGGRDWLNRGFGLYRCICGRCNPPEERERRRTQRRAAAAEPEQKHKLKLTGTPA